MLRTADVGLDALHRVVLGSRHLLDGGGVDDVVDSLHGHHQALLVADVAEEIAHARRIEDLLHLELLELVAREDYEPLRLRGLKYAPDEALAE